MTLRQLFFVWLDREFRNRGVASRATCRMQGTVRTRRCARRAAGRPEIHHGLIEITGTLACFDEGGQPLRKFCARDGLAEIVGPHEIAGENTGNVAVNNRNVLVKADAGDRCRGVGADA